MPRHGDRGPLLGVEVGEGAEECILARSNVQAHRRDGGGPAVLDLGVDRAVGRVDQVDLGAAGALIVDLEPVPAGLGQLPRPAALVATYGDLGGRLAAPGTTVTAGGEARRERRARSG